MIGFTFIGIEHGWRDRVRAEQEPGLVAEFWAINRDHRRSDAMSCDVATEAGSDHRRRLHRKFIDECFRGDVVAGPATHAKALFQLVHITLAQNAGRILRLTETDRLDVFSGVVCQLGRLL